MEKPVDDKGNALASEYVEHHHAHSSHDMEVKHHSKEHEDEVVDGEDKEKSTSHDAHDDGKAGSDHASQDIHLLHEKHASSSKDAGVSPALSEKMDTDVHVAHGNEDMGMIHEHEGTSATREKQEHNIEHAPLAHEPVEVPSHGKHASHNMDADITHESIEKLMSHEKVVHDHDVSAVTHEHVEKSTTLEKATHDDKPVGPAHESGERHKAHEKAMHDDEHVGLAHEYGDRQHTDNAQNIKDLQEMQERPTTHDQVTHVCTDMDLALQAKHTQNNELGHAPHASEKQSPVGREHRSDVENGNRHHTPRDKSPEHGDDAGVAHEHGHKPRCDVLCANTSQEHDEKCRSVEDECESKKAFSDENSSRERVLFSRGSTPDVDTPTQPISSPFSNTKPSKAGLKGLGNAERGPGSTDGNLETPSTSWAFSVRASIAPSKFDHMATLRITYAAYKESNQGKEGVKLSLLPEILESARFMVPPPRDLVPLLQRIDIEYKVGDLVRWSLLQNLALQIERKEARYPAVFIPRPSVARPNSNSPNSWKAQQRSPTRRTHPEDDCPELEPQVYEMMKEIDNHRRKSAKEGNYLAADAAAQRLLELKLFEDNKRRAIMLERHAQEREQAEKAYKGELQERNQLWDERLKNFQKEVVDHAQRLKQQHIAALQHFKEKMASKTPAKAQWSRELLKQRRIQIYLGKQGKYLEAQEVKQSADRMEQAELQAAIAAFQAELIGKEQTVRVKQQTEMDILLQRAARTREEIRKSRTLDLQRCHQRHKNVMRELAAIQKQEVFRFDQLMQKKVHNPYTGVGFGGQRVVQSPAARARMNAPDYSTDDAVYSGGEDSSMKD